MLFDYNIPPIAIALFAAALIILIYICFVYAQRLKVIRKHFGSNDYDLTDATDLPGASVVVYAHNDDVILSETLPLILNQQYKGRFEVIVVNDGNPIEADMIVTRLKATYPNLYLTFAPDNSRNLSRKKLAITLGVKAARYGVIVLTDAATLVPSEHWLEQMVAPFTDPRTEVVLGYNSMNPTDQRWMGRLTSLFDYAADSVAWLSTAIKGNPYRGCGSNIAYRKEVFMRNKGFSNSINLRNGDDDLFVNEITTPTNTVVQLSEATLGTTGTESDLRKYSRQRREHEFTGKKLPKTSRRIMATGECLMWILPVLVLGGAYFSGIHNIFGWSLAALLILIMIIVVIVSWRKTIMALNGPRLLFTIPFMAATRPLRNILIKLTSGSRINACYTWQ